MLAAAIPPAAGQTNGEINLNQQVRGELPVARGGTGATNTAAARGNLGLNTEFLAEAHDWLGRQNIRDLGGVRFAHMYASSGDGSTGNPYKFPSGNPWAAAIADGGSVIFFSPGFYIISACPATIPGNVSLIALQRQKTILRTTDCFQVPNRRSITNATNQSPIEITTSGAHGYATGEWVNITGVPGNTAANGDWQITVVDSTRFTLNGSTGNGNFADILTGYWAARIYRTSSITKGSPIVITTSTNHDFQTGDRVLVTDTSSFFTNGSRYVRVTGANTIELDLTAGATFENPQPGFVRGYRAADAIRTATDAKDVQVHGFRIESSGNTLIRNVFGIRASESSFSELTASIGSMDPAAVTTSATFDPSAAVDFTANANPGSTIQLEMTGAGSRASGPYPTYTVTAMTWPALAAITSTAGQVIKVQFQSNHGITPSGEIITIASTPETVAAGAAGTWRAGPQDGDEITLAGSSGTGTSCSSGCGGAVVTESAIRPGAVASRFATHLNSLPAFTQDYYAVAAASKVHLIARYQSARPATFILTSSAPSTTTAWADTGRGGNNYFSIENNSFSSKFSRIKCEASLKLTNCFYVWGLNNQHGFYDSRFSPGNNGNWGFRFSPGSSIQDMNIQNVTVEAAYGGIEAESLTSSSISGLYMEAAQEFGVRISDTKGPVNGISFVHGNSLNGGLFLGKLALDLDRGTGISVEGAVIAGGCRIGGSCENCAIRGSFAPLCTNESPSGFTDDWSPSLRPLRPVDRWGGSIASNSAALLGKPVTNYLVRSDDLTVSPWTNNASTALVTDTNPLGEQQKLSRTSVSSPAQFTIYNAGIQSVSGLAPDTTYLASYWSRVVTPVTGGVQLRASGSFINKAVRIVDEDGWIRIAGPLRTNSSGVATLAVNYEVLDAGLPSISVDTWGVMLTEMRNNGGLPPYVPTVGSPVTVPIGLYMAGGLLSGRLANSPNCRTYSVEESALTAASTSQDVTLFQLPARGVITGITIKHSAAFSGGGLTGMTVSVGDQSNATLYAPAFDVFQAVSDTAFADSGGFKSSTFAARDVFARFTSTGGNVVNATAGKVEVTSCYAVRP